jgi:hypothetical protein
MKSKTATEATIQELRMTHHHLHRLGAVSVASSLIPMEQRKVEANNRVLRMVALSRPKKNSRRQPVENGSLSVTANYVVQAPIEKT